MPNKPHSTLQPLKIFIGATDQSSHAQFQLLAPTTAALGIAKNPTQYRRDHAWLTNSGDASLFAVYVNLECEHNVRGGLTNNLTRAAPMAFNMKQQPHRGVECSGRVIAMEAAGVWNWAKDYVDPDICDGTQWSLAMQYRGRSIRSEGSNAYPGTSEPDYPRTRSFEAFLGALLQLTGVAID